MWSSVNEQITDGTSGLVPNESPIAIVIGSCSKTEGLSKPVTIGRDSDITQIFGVGELPRRLKDMQRTMADCSIIAIKADDVTLGTVSSIHAYSTDDKNPNTNIVDMAVTGNPIGQADIIVTALSDGTLETVNIQVLIEGDIYKKEQNIKIQDGIYKVEELGICIQFDPASTFKKDDNWAFSITGSQSDFVTLEKKIINALEMYTPEFVYIAQSVDGNFAINAQELADELFGDHKPCFFLLETTLDSSRPLHEAIALKKEEFTEAFSKTSGRFVSVVCMDGYVRTPEAISGLARRSPSGLCAGHITKAAVNQSIGATNNFPVSQYELADDWLNSDSRALDEAKFITLRTYAGLDSLYWSNGRTMADDKSDYRYIEVVRTVFKAIRLARRASLPYIHGAGDEVGLQNLITEVRTAVSNMVDMNPKELDYCNVSIPEGQDVINNGVRLDIELFGIPVIRKILLNFAFKYDQA